jgi:hypothetical protein
LLFGEPVHGLSWPIFGRLALSKRAFVVKVFARYPCDTAANADHGAGKDIAILLKESASSSGYAGSLHISPVVPRVNPLADRRCRVVLSNENDGKAKQACGNASGEHLPGFLGFGIHGGDDTSVVAGFESGPRKSPDRKFLLSRTLFRLEKENHAVQNRRLRSARYIQV